MVDELSRRAPVAQRIEQLPSKQTVAGSSPAWGATDRECGGGPSGEGFLSDYPRAKKIASN